MTLAAAIVICFRDLGMSRDAIAMAYAVPVEEVERVLRAQLPWPRKERP